MAAWASVGPLRQLGRERAGRSLETVVVEDAVDHVPALERLGVVGHAGHHELAGPAGARPLGQALGPAHRRRQTDDLLDQPELGPPRGEDQVAGQRELERPGQAQPVGGEHGRAGQRVDAAGELDQADEQRRRVGGGLLGGELEPRRRRR